MRITYLSKFAAWRASQAEIPFRGTGGTSVDNRQRLYKYIISSEHLEQFDYLEFGVAGGDSLRWWVEHNPHPGSRFWGFDTFTGNPEEWAGLAAGQYSTDGCIPEIKDARCQCVKGMFQDTLEDFLRTYTPQERRVIHMDADLYTSTLFVLTTLGKGLRAGDIILFDDFSTPTHDFRALHDFAGAFRFKYRVLGEANDYTEVVLRLE